MASSAADIDNDVDTFAPLLSRFTELTHHERRSFLTQLSARFRPSDWWCMHQLLTDSSYNFDILGSLPLELASLVAEFINPLELVRLRAVSKRWNMILTSEPVYSKSARRHFQDDVKRIKQSDDKRGNWQWRRFFENVVSRNYFFQTGRPTGKWLLQPDGRNARREQDIQGRLLAWICLDSMSFCVQCLDTREFLFRNTVSPQRERFGRIFLLKRHVIVTTLFMTKLYVWDIETKQCITYRLPNSHFVTIASDEDLVCIPSAEQFLVYNVDTNLSTSVSIRLEDHDHFIAHPERHTYLNSRIVDARARTMSYCTMFLHNTIHYACVSIDTYSVLSGNLVSRHDRTIFEGNMGSLSWLVLSTNFRCGERKYCLGATSWVVDHSDEMHPVHDILIVCYDVDKDFIYGYHLRIYGIRSLTAIWIWEGVFYMLQSGGGPMWSVTVPSSVAFAGKVLSPRDPYVVTPKKVETDIVSDCRTMEIIAGPSYMLVSRNEVLEFKGIHERGGGLRPVPEEINS